MIASMWRGTAIRHRFSTVFTSDQLAGQSGTIIPQSSNQFIVLIGILILCGDADQDYKLELLVTGLLTVVLLLLNTESITV